VGLLRLALPTALVLWFLWKSRGNTLFLLGIPVLMVMRGSVFFDKMKPFWVPGRLDSTTLLMVWLLLAWVVTLANERTQPDRELRRAAGARLLPEELPLIAIALLIGWHALRAFGVSGDLAEAVSVASASFFIVLGYVVVRGIVTRATRAETEEFLAAVVVVNTIAAALFILHQGLGLPIYEGSANINYTFAGQDIARATTFVPQFSLLALGFVLAKRAWSAKWLVVLGITMLSVLVTYTRTLLIAAVAGLIIAVVARELSKPEAGRFLRRTGAIVLCAIATLVIFSAVLPVQYRFLLTRVDELRLGGDLSQVHNWELRTAHWAVTTGVTAKENIVLGVGFPQNVWNPVEPHLFTWTSDMAWVPILYRFGYAGLALFGVLLGGSMWRALSLSLKPPEERRELALAYFITLALTVIMSFQQWTFMEPRIYPMGLWILALVAAEALRPNVDQSELKAG
jgi:hypothetical protein